MPVKLNDRAFEHATNLIEQGKFVFDERDMWSEHQPSTGAENEFIKEHGFGEYGKWHLGIDTDEDEDTNTSGLFSPRSLMEPFFCYA